MSKERALILAYLQGPLRPLNNIEDVLDYVTPVVNLLLASSTQSALVMGSTFEMPRTVALALVSQICNDPNATLATLRASVDVLRPQDRGALLAIADAITQATVVAGSLRVHGRTWTNPQRAGAWTGAPVGDS